MVFTHKQLNIKYITNNFFKNIILKMNSISINVGIVEFMDYFPLLKQGKANIKTIYYIIKSYNVLTDSNIKFETNNDNTEFDDYLIKILNNKKTYVLKEYEEECVLAYELLDIICTCKSVNHKPKTGSGWKRIEIIARHMHAKSPELSLFILYMCICSNSHLINKISTNNYVKLVRDIYQNYWYKINNTFYIKERQFSEVKELIQINLGNLDPRYGNNTLYKFAELLNETETCYMIKELSIKRNLIEKQVLINNFEDLIGPSDIPNNIFNYTMKFI